jgi:hypothetical protein
VLGAETPRDLAQLGVRGTEARVLDDAQHAARGGVMGLQQLAPVGQVPPGRLSEGGVVRLHQDVSVAQAPAADARAVEHDDVPERADLEDAPAADARRPEIAPEVPGRRCEILVPEPPPPLEDEHAVALLGQSHGRHAAAEAGADHDEVVDVLSHARSRAVGRAM